MFPKDRSHGAGSRWQPHHTAILLVSAALALAACGTGPGSGASPSTGSASLGPRPSSPAVVRIVSPANGAELAGSTAHVVVQVDNARIVQTTSTNIRPDEGHIHLYLDNALIYMNYTLQQDVPVTPGTYVLKAEFVASDHAPFNPRVWSDNIVFTVQ